ncbi:MAG: carboxypeptidase regulatory-like domain-containing protein [Bryobacterales bacterium]|nr:carboxypeptidase regulatory-like domain-containing protein [Bryobacterales bacterium]
MMISATALALLTGVAVDVTGAALAGTTVELRAAPTASPITTVRTGAEGQFSFPAIPPGAYHLRLSQTGFRSRAFGPVTVTEEPLALPPITLQVGVKHSAFYCNTKLAAPRYMRKPASVSALRLKATANGTATLTGGRQPITVNAEDGGVFEFRGLPPGRYSLRAEFPEYAPFSIPRLTIPRKTALELEGWIDTPDCPGKNRSCPEVRKVLRQDETKTSICL